MKILFQVAVAVATVVRCRLMCSSFDQRAVAADPSHAGRVPNRQCVLSGYFGLETCIGLFSSFE
jgi:hypothetical protein